jgi:hypothetical protein
MIVEEIMNRSVGANLIRLPREPVSLVVEDDVFNDAVIFLHRLNDLIGFGLDDARVVRALQDDERLTYLVGVKQQRNFAQIFDAGFGVADLFVECLPLRLLVGRH